MVDGHYRIQSVEPEAFRGIEFFEVASKAYARQSTITVTIGVVIGVPLGIVVGRVIWTAFAQAMHAVVVTTISPWSVFAVAAGAVVLANAVAITPALLAARTSTSTLLRAE
jgi:ABC-type lipoprotein release transport system permease subunit